jgi:phosphoglycerate dehydrogenase-like enzyme
MRVVLNGGLACQGAGLLRARFGDRLEVLEVADGDRGTAVAEKLGRAEVLVTLGFDERLPPLPRLRLIQLPVAGLDQVRLDLVPAGCPVCNVFEHELGISEHVLAAMLHFTVDLAGRSARFKAGSWAESPLQGGPARRELAGQTVLCIGYGHIGRQVAARARAFGMKVAAITASGRAGEPAPEVAGGPAELGRLLEVADFVVLACPLSAATRGMIGAAELVRMKPGAVLINVARGALIDEQALFEALRERRIGGAALDTWYRYPSPEEPVVRPAERPFHELDNVVMTPHCSGWTEGLMARRFALIGDNLERLAAGRPLLNQVHPRPG